MPVTINIVTRLQDAALKEANRELLSLGRAAIKSDVGVTGALLRTSASMANAGAKMKAVGRNLSTYVSLPMAALGYVAVKSAISYQKSMTLIQTQTGGTAKDVTQLSAAILNMKNSQYGPNAAADAIYHLKSVGMSNVESLKALKVAEEGAAVGGSDLEQTASALAGVWVTGIKGAGSYAHTMAEVNAIVGTGNMRLQDFVTSLGSGIMPAAKNFGVSLQSVGAAMAFMTDRGVPATRAATYLRMALQKMGGNPTAPAEKILTSVGLGAHTLAYELRKPDGLLLALEDLKKHMDAAGLNKVQQAADYSDMFGGMRGSMGVVMLLSKLTDGVSNLTAKYNKMQHMSGTFSGSVEAQGKTIQAQWNEAKAALENAGIVIGDDLMPDVKSVAHDVEGLVGAFNKLSPGTKHLLVDAGIISALLGPMFSIGGTMLTGAAMFVGYLGKISLKYRLWKKAANEAQTASEEANAAAGVGGAGEEAAAVTGGATAAEAAGVTGGTAAASGAGVEAIAAGGTAAAGVPVVIVGAAALASVALGAGIVVALAKYKAPTDITPSGHQQGGRGAHPLTGQVPDLDSMALAAHRYGSSVANALSETEKISVQMVGAGATSAQMKNIDAEIVALRKLAKNPVTLGDVSAPHTPAELLYIRDHLETSLKLTAKQADAIMHRMFFDWDPAKDLTPKVQAAEKYLQSQTDRWKALGFSLADAVALGVKLGTPGAVSQIDEMSNLLILSAKEKLRSHSPSRVMIPIGESIPQGLAVGIAKGTPSAVKALNKSLSSLTAAAQLAHAGSSAMTSTAGLSGGLKSIVSEISAARHWNVSDWLKVISRESGGSMTAKNPSSGAYGIAKFIQGPSEYAKYGGNVNTLSGQLTAMANYIAGRYGNPTNAWGHELSAGWYDKGGYLPKGWSVAYNGTGHLEPVGAAVGGGGNTTVIEINLPPGVYFGSAQDIGEALGPWVERAQHKSDSMHRRGVVGPS